jgi:uncharacterized protein YjaG (DUF416 family)
MVGNQFLNLRFEIFERIMVKTMKNNYEQELKRLVALAGTDEGFYLLALHAFIEGYCNTLKPGFTLYAKFNEVIDLLLDMLEVMGISLRRRKASH